MPNKGKAGSADAARGRAAEVPGLGRTPYLALFLTTILSTPENKLANIG